MLDLSVQTKNSEFVKTQGSVKRIKPSDKQEMKLTVGKSLAAAHSKLMLRFVQQRRFLLEAVSSLFLWQSNPFLSLHTPYLNKDISKSFNPG